MNFPIVSDFHEHYCDEHEGSRSRMLSIQSRDHGPRSTAKISAICRLSETYHSKACFGLTAGAQVLIRSAFTYSCHLRASNLELPYKFAGF